MLFNSIDFAVFLPIVFGLYWFVLRNRLREQNLLLLLASYVFYGWWDYRFLALILFSTIIDFWVGRQMHVSSSESKRKQLLWISIFVNLGLLGFFKYFNFFVGSFVDAFSFFGQEIPRHSLDIILPVGISFYTFQTLSYTIDIYRKKLAPTNDFIAFASFVSFFPQLVAGPIERATHLLPQFQYQRKFDEQKAVDGLRQILWGLFKKVVIADSCAEYADLIFGGHDQYSGSTLALGAIFFTFQIYCDFSGYSDIAIGTGRLFGFNLRKNFAFPYFSRDIAEFWRRWHISLSTWFRDYVYIPLGGSRVSRFKVVRNVFIIFIVSGFWHGADWTFIAWGTLNAFYFLPLILFERNRKNLDTVAQGKWLPNIREILGISITFSLTVFAWIFFRAENMPHALTYIQELFSSSLFSVPSFPRMKNAFITLILISIFLIIEWIGREKEYAIEHTLVGQNRIFRWLFYFILTGMILSFSGKEQHFIYFQF